MLTDGNPTDSVEAAGNILKLEEQNNGVAFFSVLVQDADPEPISGLSSRPPIPLRGLAFRELFQWLSASQKRVSGSMVGAQVENRPPPGGIAHPGPIGVVVVRRKPVAGRVFVKLQIVRVKRRHDADHRLGKRCALHDLRIGVGQVTEGRGQQRDLRGRLAARRRNPKAADHRAKRQLQAGQGIRLSGRTRLKIDRPSQRFIIWLETRFKTRI